MELIDTKWADVGRRGSREPKYLSGTSQASLFQLRVLLLLLFGLESLNR